MKKTLRKEEIEKQAEKYLNSCGNHLFVRATESCMKRGTIATFYKIFPMWVEEDLYFVRISFDKLDLSAKYRSYGVTFKKVYTPELFDEYGDDLVNVLKKMTFFPQWYKYKSIRNFKRMNRFIEDFKPMLLKSSQEELTSYIQEKLGDLVENQYKLNR